jgi:hypothetical protein
MWLANIQLCLRHEPRCEAARAIAVENLRGNETVPFSFLLSLANVGLEMDNNQNLSAVPVGPPAKRAADFNVDKIMENYKVLVDRQIDRVSAKFGRNRNPKDGAEELKLLNQMVKTLLMHEPFRRPRQKC